MNNPFAFASDTVNIAVTAISQALALTAGIGNVMITNIGAQTVFIKFGNSAITVTVSNGYPVLGNSTQAFAKGESTHCAAIAAAAGSTLYSTSGEGI